MTDTRRPQFFRRARLLDRLEAAAPGSLVLVVAGSGHGKSTLVNQWAAQSAHAVRVVTVREGCDSLDQFANEVVAALATIEPAVKAIVERAQRGIADWMCSLLPSLLELIDGTSVSLVIDDAHHVRSPPSVEFLRELAYAWPSSGALVLAGRQRPQVGLLRARFDAPVHLLSEDDLDFDEHELRELLVSRALDPSRAAEILEWTGGWPAGVRLALASRPAPSATDRRGGDVDLETEGLERVMRSSLRPLDGFDPWTSMVLADLTQDEVEFLELVSVLTPTTTAIADKVLNRNDTLSILENLLRRNVPMVELIAGSPAGIVIHPLLATALCDRLERDEPTRLGEVRRRAVGALIRERRFEQAAGFLEALGDRDGIVTMLYRFSVYFLHVRQVDRLRTLLRRFSIDEVRANPALAIVAAYSIEPRDEALYRAMTARVAADTTTRMLDGSNPASVIRRTMTAFGFTPADRTDVDPENLEWTMSRLAAEAFEDYLSDRLEDAETRLTALGAMANLAVFTEATRLGALALVVAESGRVAEAEILVTHANELVDRNHPADSGFSYIVDIAALVVLRAQGRNDEIEPRLIAARRKMAVCGDGKKLWHARGLLEVASIALELGEPPLLVAELLDEVGPLVQPWQGLTRLDAMMSDLSCRLERVMSTPRVAGGDKRGSLTTAELRLLAYLPSHYTIPRIAEELRIAHSTAKTQCLAVYRKLGVNDRSEAVRQARKLGLVQPAVR